VWAGLSHQQLSQLRNIVDGVNSRGPKRMAFEQLQPTQRRARTDEARSAVTAVLNALKVPLAALIPRPSTPPAALLHLSTSERDRIRTVGPTLRIPCEQSIIELKRWLAKQYATETSAFQDPDCGGAYISDPVTLVNHLASSSPFLAVGGDAGGGHVKLGITYHSSAGTQQFAALLVFSGKDTSDELCALTQLDGLTPFTGASAAHTSIWSVLQSLIATHPNAFLNGDWPFLCVVLGLKNASSKHPCPICGISSSNLLGTAKYRSALNNPSALPASQRLLRIAPERIVPTPLHLYLGLSNRLILEAFGAIFGEQLVADSVARIKTVHSAGKGGASDLYDLNGSEVRKYITRECPAALLASGGDSLTAEQRSRHGIFTRWLHQLHASLLHDDDWTPDAIEAWRAVVDDVQLAWQSETGQQPFPKLHMLRHTLEFAERHRMLGRVSEAQIESFHAKFNALFHHNHRNMTGDTSERIRRSLADTALHAVQPLLLASPSPL
jgi:hypothetical protein